MRLKPLVRQGEGSPLGPGPGKHGVGVDRILVANEPETARFLDGESVVGRRVSSRRARDLDVIGEALDEGLRVDEDEPRLRRDLREVLLLRDAPGETEPDGFFEEVRRVRVVLRPDPVEDVPDAVHFHQFDPDRREADGVGVEGRDRVLDEGEHGKPAAVGGAAFKVDAALVPGAAAPARGAAVHRAPQADFTSAHSFRQAVAGVPSLSSPGRG